MHLSEGTVAIVGAIAGTLTTVAFIPQVIRVWRLKDARGISLPTFLLFSVGLLAWMIYGLLIGSVPVLVANAVTLILAGTILSLKLKFDRASVSATA